MMTNHKRLLVALVLPALLFSATAQAQSRERDLSGTVERLGRQLQTLERTVYRDAPAPSVSLSSVGVSPPPSALSDLQITSNSLEEQQRRLTGQIEKLEFQVRQLNERMDRLVGDVDFRLRELEDVKGVSQASRGGGNPVAPTVPQSPGEVTVRVETGSGSKVFGTLTESELQAAGVKPSGSEQNAAVPAVTVATPLALPAGSTQDQYSYARQFLLKRDFDNAEKALSAFVTANPEDPLAGNAQYWLGETFYVRGDYQTAARIFAEGFQRYPGSAKAPDNLLKLGMSLSQLDQKNDACVTLKKLREEYPLAPNSIIQRAEREIGRLQCG
ncbi:MAG: tol-pal system protein YbgF [Alphaproteobacteria bacterium]|nr:tol-pal system protein YbgF [Alphaproteobacteria bacterium]